MSDKKKVVLVGWEPEVLDYTKIPNMTAEKVRSMLEADRDNLRSEGYDADIFYISSSETAFDCVSEALKKTSYDAVLIGAGVRRADEHFIVFEQLVNAVHQNAPNTKICFNTNPGDTAEAIKRWV